MDGITITLKNHFASAQALLRDSSRYGRFADQLILVYCATAALSIAMSQAVVVVLLLSWLVWHFSHQQQLSQAGRRAQRLVAAPVVTWLAVSYLSTFIGVNTLQAIPEALKSSLYVLLPFAVFEIILNTCADRREMFSRVYAYLTALVGGQLVASAHTVLSAAAGRELPPKIPGPVTEAGQLVLVIPAVFALLLMQHITTKEVARTKQFLTWIGASLALGLSLIIVAWPQVCRNCSPLVVQLFAGAVGIIVILATVFSSRQLRAPNMSAADSRAALHRLAWVAGVILFAALVINLKRGPWLGVFTICALLGLMISRRFLLWGIVISIAAFVALEPVRTRTAHSAQDFAISGGRQLMWELGGELLSRYPLGLGPNNARVIRQIDPTLPDRHLHMHNNLLNVAVESGWLGLAAYLWWMYEVIRLGLLSWIRLRAKSSLENQCWGVIGLTLGLALLGWQVAGIVEYNFGDGEIRLISFFYMGIVMVVAAIADSLPERA